MAIFWRSQRLIYCFLIGSLTTFSLTPPSLAQSINGCELSQAIATITNSPENKKAQWGIAVQNINDQQIIYTNNADKFFIPASNLKLLTTAAALEILGKDYQFKTSIYTIGDASHLTKLILKGSGDPTLTTAQLETALIQLKNKGVTQIDQVILDDSYFTELPTNPTWEWSDLATYYATPVNSFILNENTVTITFLPSKIGQPATFKWSNDLAAKQWQLDNQLITANNGTVYNGNLSQKYGTTDLLIKGEIAANADADVWDLSIPDPDQYVLDNVKQILSKSNIVIRDETILSQTSANLDQAQLLTTILSEPLAEIIKKTNQESNNLFAESLRQTLNSEHHNIPEILTNLDVDPDSYHLEDGSGLSRHDLVTPMAFVQTLEGMSAQPDAQIYKDSLAIAGQTGTLRNRFKDTPIANHFFGKTGSMTNVAALSGYLDPPNHDTLALSILVNQSTQPSNVTKAAIDEIVGAVYDWSQCQTEANP